MWIPWRTKQEKTTQSALTIMMERLDTDVAAIAVARAEVKTSRDELKRGRAAKAAALAQGPPLRSAPSPPPPLLSPCSVASAIQARQTLITTPNPQPSSSPLLLQRASRRHRVEDQGHQRHVRRHRGPNCFAEGAAGRHAHCQCHQQRDPGQHLHEGRRVHAADAHGDRDDVRWFHAQAAVPLFCARAGVQRARARRARVCCHSRVCCHQCVAPNAFVVTVCGAVGHQHSLWAVRRPRVQESVRHRHTWG